MLYAELSEELQGQREVPRQEKASAWPIQAEAEIVGNCTLPTRQREDDSQMPDTPDYSTLMSETFARECTRPERAVLLAMICAALGDDGKCHASLDLICWYTGYKRRNVMRVMRDFRERSVLEVEAKSARSKPVEYSIHLEKLPVKESFADWKERHEEISRCPKTPIPSTLRWKVWERDDFTCQHCGTRQYLSIDHVMPESLGGEMVESNLQTLCKPCNSRKGVTV